MTTASARNYLSFEAFATTPKVTTGLYKFDESFGVTWSRAINFASTTHSMAIVDMDFTSTYSIALSYADTIGSTADFFVLTVFNETTGETLAEQTFAGDKVQSSYGTDGCVRLISNSWYLAIQTVMVVPASTPTGYAYDTISLSTGALTVTTGAVTTAAITSFLTPTLALISP